MSDAKFDTLMIFAAGLGSRMGNLTKNQPKSLLKIKGKPLLYYALELALTYPFKQIIINTHYFALQVTEAIQFFISQHPKCPEIKIIFEPIRLETGGGIKNILPLITSEAIFTMNSDVIIKPEKINVFEHLQHKWNAAEMDMLLLLQNYSDAIGYKGNGDFEIGSTGKLYRPDNVKPYKFMFSGLQIVSSNLIKNNPKKIFSLSEYYQNQMTRVYGEYINHQWYHANTPKDIEQIESLL